VTRTAQQFLKSPKAIVGELAALALLCTLGAAIPQQGTATGAELEQLHQAGPVLAWLVNALGLDHVFRNPLFLSVAALTSASLFVVILGQLKRLRFQWSARLTEAHFRSAPFRAEFEVELPQNRESAPSAHTRIWTERRIGLLGSPVFHIGLLLLIMAGALQALFSTSAIVDLVEGETLPPEAKAWGAQFSGMLGKPFHLDGPITLQTVKAARYTDGDLRDLKIEVAHALAGKTEIAEIAVNHDLKIGGSRLFLGSDFGPAALLEWQRAGAVSNREAVLLKERGAGNFEGAANGSGGEVTHVRVLVGANGERPGGVEIRVMKNGALLFTGDLAAGQAVNLPGGETLILHSTPFWARLRGIRDSALWLAYASFALLMTGVVLIFTVVKVDCCVAVTPLGDKCRIFVALKPHRLAPLFQERFDLLVRQQQEAAGGTLAAPGVPAARKTPPPRWFSSAASQTAAALLLVLSSGALSGCGKSASETEQARKLVERYNQVVSEAYRRGDVRLTDSVVGPKEGKKLTGLIGVRLDEGMTLDSQLVSLEVTGVEKAGEEMRVRTKERWHYCDRKIGSGALVGEESTDSYEMLYLFKKMDKKWLVDEIQFTSKPIVGRTKLPFPTERPSASADATVSTQKQESKP